MDNKYQTGKYWEKNTRFHEEDSDFKFQNFMTLLKRNPHVKIHGLINMGCGAGRITWQFSEKYEHIKCVGIDLSENIIAYAKKICE